MPMPLRLRPNLCVAKKKRTLKECNDDYHDGDDNGSDPVTNADADTEVGDATFRRASYTEEDLYCCVGDCLRAFKNP